MSGEWVREILNRWGEQVTICRDGEEYSVRAFVQPAGEDRGKMPETFTAAGWVDGRLWVFLGLDEARSGDVVRWRDLSFRVRSGRGYYAGGVLGCWQAVLERERCAG